MLSYKTLSYLFPYERIPRNNSLGNHLKLFSMFDYKQFLRKPSFLTVPTEGLVIWVNKVSVTFYWKWRQWISLLNQVMSTTDKQRSKQICLYSEKDLGDEHRAIMGKIQRIGWKQCLMNYVPNKYCPYRVSCEVELNNDAVHKDYPIMCIWKDLGVKLHKNI